MKKLIALLIASAMLTSACSASTPKKESDMPAQETQKESETAEVSSSSDDDFAYPTRSVEILVPAAPGGNTDMVPRTYAKYLEKLWDVPIVITNMKSQTALCCIQTHDAEPDGYTLVTNTDSPFIEYASGGIEFPIDELSIIGIWGEFPGPILVVNSTSGWKTIEDFKAACEAKPDTLTIATNYTGNTRVMAEMLKKNGLNFRIVDSEGGSDRQAKILGGHVDAVLLSWSECKDYIASGELTALCCLDTERCSDYPDIPTAQELGYNVVYPTRHFLSTTPGVDKRIIKIWEDALIEISNDPDFQAEMRETVGANAVFRNAAETMAIYGELTPLFDEYFKQ